MTKNKKTKIEGSSKSKKALIAGLAVLAVAGIGAGTGVGVKNSMDNKDKISELEQNKKNVLQTMEGLLKQIKAQEAEIERLNKTMKANEAKTTAENKTLAELVAEAGLKKTELENSIDKKNKEISSLNDKLEEADKRIKELEAEIKDLEIDKATFYAEAKSVNEFLAVKQKELKELKENQLEIKGSEEDYQHLQAEVDEADAEIKKSEEKLETANKIHNNLLIEYNYAIAEKEILLNEKLKVEQELAKAKRKINELEEEVEGLKKELAKVWKGAQKEINELDARANKAEAENKLWKEKVLPRLIKEIEITAKEVRAEVEAEYELKQTFTNYIKAISYINKVKKEEEKIEMSYDGFFQYFIYDLHYRIHGKNVKFDLNDNKKYIVERIFKKHKIKKNWNKMVGETQKKTANFNSERPPLEYEIFLLTVTKNNRDRHLGEKNLWKGKETQWQKILNEFNEIIKEKEKMLGIEDPKPKTREELLETIKELETEIKELKTTIKNMKVYIETLDKGSKLAQKSLIKQLEIAKKKLTDIKDIILETNKEVDNGK